MFADKLQLEEKQIDRRMWAILFPKDDAKLSLKPDNRPHYLIKNISTAVAR